MTVRLAQHARSEAFFHSLRLCFQEPETAAHLAAVFAVVTMIDVACPMAQVIDAGWNWPKRLADHGLLEVTKDTLQEVYEAAARIGGKYYK